MRAWRALAAGSSAARQPSRQPRRGSLRSALRARLDCAGRASLMSRSRSGGAGSRNSLPQLRLMPRAHCMRDHEHHGTSSADEDAAPAKPGRSTRTASQSHRTTSATNPLDRGWRVEITPLVRIRATLAPFALDAAARLLNSLLGSLPLIVRAEGGDSDQGEATGRSPSLIACAALEEMSVGYSSVTAR